MNRSNNKKTTINPENINPAKTGLIVFVLTLVFGLAMFIGFGMPAGVFSDKKLIDALTGSPSGWAALFGATLILGAPIIGASLWAMDRVVKKTLEKATTNKHK
jgi:hypothetical protein